MYQRRRRRVHISLSIACEAACTSKNSVKIIVKSIRFLTTIYYDSKSAITMIMKNPMLHTEPKMSRFSTILLGIS